MDVKEIREALHAMFGGENKQITDGNYDKALAIHGGAFEAGGTIASMTSLRQNRYRAEPIIFK